MANSGNDNGRQALSLTEAAAQVGVAPATSCRWTRDGLIPQYLGEWSAPAVSHGRCAQEMFALSREGEE
jgi:hypothetical protein